MTNVAIIMIIILFAQKPKMQQCKLKTWTLNKTHQAEKSRKIDLVD